MDTVENAVQAVRDSARPAEETVPLLRRELGMTRTVLFERIGARATPHGIALSPAEALRCMDDAQRTAVFMRAVHGAIRAMLLKTSERPLQVLDVGCGPFAALTLPVFTQFLKEDIELTCVDMHEMALKQVMFTAKVLRQRLVRIFDGDFITCTGVGDRKYHVGVAEAMLPGLFYEPQLAITAAAAQHMHPDGIWIPREIGLRAYLQDQSWAQQLGMLATLTIHSAQELFEKGINGKLSIPEDTHFPADSEPQLCIGTRIHAHDSHVLGEKEALITMPVGLDTVPTNTKLSAVEIFYRGGDFQGQAKVQWHGL